MINSADQEELLRLIANYLDKDISCIAIGGTAMMFKGYKNTTKDIDLVFESSEDRSSFISAIQKLGYKEIAIANIYDHLRKTHRDKPIMFSRGDERFDLFVRKVFGFEVSFDQKSITERIDFIAEHHLSVRILSQEELILLKAITSREKDYEDIETIMEIEKNVDWQKIVDLGIQQKKHNEWILIDLEETMQQLKKKYFIKKEFFESIYQAESQ